jgi:hypothetical protein
VTPIAVVAQILAAVGPPKPYAETRVEQAGADGEQHVRAQPGRLVGQFPLRTDRPAEHGSEQQAAEQLEVAWHGNAPGPGSGC